jgi:hypothetical protein
VRLGNQPPPVRRPRSARVGDLGPRVAQRSHRDASVVEVAQQTEREQRTARAPLP